jgi:nicotinate phosphoribosyltransferase
LEDQELNPQAALIIDPNDPTRRKRMMPAFYQEELLLKPIFEKGKLVYELPTIVKIRERVQSQLDSLDKTHKRLVNPHLYPIGLEENLHQLRMELVLKAKQVDTGNEAEN